MRWLNWRRATALIAIIVGVAVGATAPASAAAHGQHADHVTTQDAWW